MGRNQQFVAIKSQGLLHGLGAEAVVAEAVVGMASAAHAPTSHEAAAAVSINAAKMPSFVMRTPPPSRYATTATEQRLSDAVACCAAGSPTSSDMQLRCDAGSDPYRTADK